MLKRGAQALKTFRYTLTEDREPPGSREQNLTSCLRFPLFVFFFGHFERREVGFNVVHLPQALLHLFFFLFLWRRIGGKGGGGGRGRRSGVILTSCKMLSDNLYSLQFALI